MKVTNTAKGPRGVALKDGSTFYLEAGQTEDLDVDGELYEGVVKAGSAEAKAAADESDQSAADPLDHDGSGRKGGTK